jgi:hypothetical protein
VKSVQRIVGLMAEDKQFPVLLAWHPKQASSGGVEARGYVSYVLYL